MAGTKLTETALSRLCTERGLTPVEISREVIRGRTVWELALAAPEYVRPSEVSLWVCRTRDGWQVQTGHLGALGCRPSPEDIKVEASTCWLVDTGPAYAALGDAVEHLASAVWYPWPSLLKARSKLCS